MMLGNTKTEHHDPKMTAQHILVLFASALGIRAYLWLKFPHVIFLHEADAFGYISIARNIIENFSISNATHFPPFYPTLVAIFYMITGNYESGARFASILMGSVMVIPFYLACKYLVPVRAAFCAALLAACFGPFVDYSLQPVSQATYIGLVAFGVWIGLRCVKIPSLEYLTMFGMTSAAIYLTRPEGILFFAINIPVLIYAIYSERSKLERRLYQSGLLIFSFLIPFLWYVISLKKFTGNWTISGKSGIATIGMDASMKLLPDGKTYGEMAAGKAGLADLFSSFSGFIATYLAQLGKYSSVVFNSVPKILFIFAIVGLVHLVYELSRNDKGDTIKTLCLYWMIFSPLAMLLPVMAFDKIAIATGYVLPFYMVLFCFSAKGIFWLEELTVEWLGKLCSLTASDVRRYIPLALIASILLSWYMYMPLYKWLSSDNFHFMSVQQDFVLRKTGQWFSNNTEKSAKLMARWSGNIGYYSERVCAGLADGSISEVTEYARRQGITYIVIDSLSVPRRRPQLKDLLIPSIPQPGLIPVYADEQFDARVVIYHVK